MDQQDEIVAVAADILTRRYGGTQKLSAAERLGGSGSAHVYRVKVASNPFFPQRTVVVKHAPATGSTLDDAAFLREVVAYQFTTSLSAAVRPGPTLLGYDTEQRLIILSDSGDGETLADALQRADATEHVAILRNLGTALGKMHAGTADEEDAFNVLFHRMTRSRAHSADIQQLRDRLLVHRIRLGVELLKRSGIEVPDEVALTASNLQNRLLTGGMRAFTPFDLSPDNVIYSDGHHHFLDYEWAGFRDVSFDVAFVVARFPMYLSAQPFNAQATEAFIEAWVAEVAQTWPGVRNADTLKARITAAMIGWALSSITMMDPQPVAEVLDSDAAMAAEFEAAGLKDPENALEIGLETGPETDSWETGDILRQRSEGQFTEDELLVRRDLRETFEALAGFAGTGQDQAYRTVEAFAQAMAERLR